MLATDHAPHLLEEKAEKYDQAPSGLPLVQLALQAALQRVFEGELMLERVFEATFVNGQRVWHGARLDEGVRGQRLAFTR